MKQLRNTIEKSSGLEVTVRGFCPVNVKEIYQDVGLDTYRFLKGDYCIEIIDGNKTVYITDFCGTYSAKKLPRNSTIVLEDNKIIYKRDNLNLSPLHYSEVPRVKKLDKLFEAIDESVKLRCSDNPTIQMSSGQDSGTIVASALKQNFQFKTLSISGREDQEILQQRLALFDDPIYITQWDNSLQSHEVAAQHCPTKHLVSGLGSDELYWSGDFQLLERFLHDSYQAYEKFGIQVRYPLLDSKVYVQYFLLEDGKYISKKRKKPLIAYMESLSFPCKNELKVPFFLGNSPK